MAQTARSTRSALPLTKRAPARPVVAKAKPAATKVKSTKALRAVVVKAPITPPPPAAPKQPIVDEMEIRSRGRQTPSPPPAMPKVEPMTGAPVVTAKPHTPPSSSRPSGIVSKGYVPLVNIPPLPLPPKNLKLTVGDKAVHPAHGLGEIIAIEHREIGGAKGEFFIIRILDNGMRVMVPRTSAQAAGLRPVMSSKEADKVLETMKAREVAVDLQPWSRRFRAYTEMIKSGSPHEVAKVLRDMYRLKFDKELSFGERRLLDQAKSLLMKELAAAKSVTEQVLQARVDEMFRT
jgi:CarD family transcriptional regulator